MWTVCLLLLLVLDLMVMVAWTRSTWACRRLNLYIRARLPSSVIAGLLVDGLAVAAICLEQALAQLRASLPCRLVQSVSTVAQLLSDGLILRRMTML